MKQYDTFKLVEDLNLDIREGMIGTILEIYENELVVEFVKSNGGNYEHNGQFTFTISKSKIELI